MNHFIPRIVRLGTVAVIAAAVARPVPAVAAAQGAGRVVSPANRAAIHFRAMARTFVTEPSSAAPTMPASTAIVAANLTYPCAESTAKRTMRRAGVRAFRWPSRATASVPVNASPIPRRAVEAWRPGRDWRVARVSNVAREYPTTRRVSATRFAICGAIATPRRTFDRRTHERCSSPWPLYLSALGAIARSRAFAMSVPWPRTSPPASVSVTATA
jgi:hypothetical protein